MRKHLEWLAVLCCAVLMAFGEASARGQGSGPPVILSDPQDQSVSTGGSASFSVQADGAVPLWYQWRLNGTNLPNATNTTFSISNVRLFNGGAYTAVVSNSFGAVTSAVATLTVDQDLVFRIITLETNGAIAVEHSNQTGDDRGGIAVSASNVFVTGDGTSGSGFNPVTGRFPLDTLTGGASIGRGYDALVSNLRTETVYSLGNGANLIQYTNGLNATVVNSLHEINGQSGQLTGLRITLSTNITVSSSRDVGIFSGYDRIVIHTGSRAFNISLPSGLVTDLGAMSSFSHNYTENNWAYWGIAEYTGSAVNLIYVRDFQTIVRTRVPDRATTTILAVTGTSWPSDMASLTFSTSRSRWYVHYEGTAFFRSGDESVGSAKGSYTTDAGYPAFIQDPADQISYPTSNVTFRATAVGAQPLYYQWYFNGNPILGATDSTLVLTNLGTNAAGLYRLDVANPSGLASSRNALLTIYSYPQISFQPQARGVVQGTNTTFSFSVNAAPPLSYQWRFNGSPLVGGTNSSLQLTNIQLSMAGLYTVLVSNQYGSTISSNGELFVAAPGTDGAIFQVTSLTTNGAAVQDIYTSLEFNYGYGPLAVSSNRVFYSRFDNSGQSSAADLSFGSLIGQLYGALVSNLRTETVYALGNASGPFGYQSGTVTTIWEVNGATGLLTTNRITLSRGIVLPAQNTSLVGFFAGYDRAVVLTGTRAYGIALPSGVVTDLGPIGSLQHGFSYSGSYWGIAEHVNGLTYLVYNRDSRNIARTRLPDGVTTNFVVFPNGLNSYFSSISASIRRGRWYFYYQFGNSTFGQLDAAIGFANATFTINSGPNADHFEWQPISGIQVLDTPFPVTLVAKNTDNNPATNYSGVVTLTGLTVPGSTAVPLAPAVVTNFVGGVWNGQIIVSQGAPGMVLRAEDREGRVGTSGVFSVSPSNDLILTITDTPDPVVVGGVVTYSINVTNTGPAPATGVVLTNLLPSGTSLISFTNSQGSCSLDGDVMVCDLGTVNVGTRALITVVVGTPSAGNIAFQARVTRNEPDPAPYDDSATELTEVTLPRLYVNDVSLIERDAGTNELTFTVRMFPPTTNTVAVSYSTFNGTATSAGASPDFVAATGVLVFPPGSTNQTVGVMVRGDTLYEANETFSLTLASPTNATLVDGTGTGTIINDDSPPFISVSNTSVTEGNTGNVNATFQIRLSTNSGVSVNVSYSTYDGTANSSTDYTNVSGVLSFSANTPNLVRTVNVAVHGDTNREPNEFFYLQLLSATNAILTNFLATGTIINDDGGGVMDHFGWSPIASPQPFGTPLPVTVFAQDIFNNTITNFNGTVNLSASATGGAVPGTIFEDAEFSNNFTGDYTLGFSFTPKSDLIVTHLRQYTGTKLSLWTDSGQRLASVTTGEAPGQWHEIALPTPVSLSAGATYILAYYTGGPDLPYYYRSDTTADFPDVTLIEGRFNSGDQFPTASLQLGWAVDIRYLVSEPPIPVLITPASSGSFVQGIWTGSVNIQTNTTNIVLTASDASQHTGASAKFDLVAASDSDLQVTLADSTNMVSVGSNLTYLITVFNRGPLGASGVTITNELPPGFDFISASVTQGTVTNSGGMVSALLGPLSKGAKTVVTVLARPGTPGVYTNAATVGASTPDPILINNRAARTTLVFRDTDGDGIWDDWELRYGLNPNDPSDAGADPDGDGHTNLDEFIAGTDPNDANSALRILGIDTTLTGTRITFRGVRGKSYRLERKDGMNGVWTPVIVLRIGSSPLASEVVEVNDPGLATAGSRFYRIQALLP